MKKGITFFLLVGSVTSCLSQQIHKSELVILLEENINRIEFSKLLFFPKELIQLGADTTFQSKFKKKLELHDNVKRKTEGDQNEYQLTLYLLYNTLSMEKNYDKEYQIGKDFLMNLLSDRSKIDFLVDENLIIQQIDVAKRGIVNGYDEGAIDKSSFLFFYNSPLLYKRTLMKNGLIDDWMRIGIFLCNYLRENENPKALREPIKAKILSMLSRREVQHEFKEVVKDIAGCDISSNLFD